MHEQWICDQEDSSDDNSSMGAVLWILVACVVLGIVLFLSIPW
jgi:hypothetical protein